LEHVIEGGEAPAFAVGTGLTTIVFVTTSVQKPEVIVAVYGVVVFGETVIFALVAPVFQRYEGDAPAATAVRLVF
jgi:hypothetical protein